MKKLLQRSFILSFLIGLIASSTIHVEAAGKSVVLGTGAKVDIRAVDEIGTGKGLSIQDGGSLTLRCDKNVELSGSEVKKGGSLNVTGEMVVLTDGFSVKPGGFLSIKGK